MKIICLDWTQCYLFQDVALIAAICGFLSCCVLLSHIFPVFLVMTLPRPTNTAVSSLHASLNASDNPPGYDTLMASQLPGYDDSIVQKTQVSSVSCLSHCLMLDLLKVAVTMEQEKEKTASLSTSQEA